MHACTTPGCGYQTAVKAVRCPLCNRCGTIDPSAGAYTTRGKWEPLALRQIKKDRVQRVKLEEPALDALFGGGLVRSCSYLFAGVPGAGKSTWALQCTQFFESPLYVTGEETRGAIKTRAERLGIDVPHLDVQEINDLELLAKHITNEYDALILDSTHSVTTRDTSAAVGTSLQAMHVTRLAADIVRKLGMVGIFVSHVDKEGDFSGMVANQHLVDGTVKMHDNRTSKLVTTSAGRLMQIQKHRHGPVDAAVFCEMTDHGLDHFRLAEEEQTNGIRETQAS